MIVIMHLSLRTKAEFMTAGIFLLLVPFVVHAQGLVPCGDPGEPECTFDHLIVLANNVIQYLIFTIAAPLAAIAFVVAGVMMVTARGNQAQLERAKSIFWYVAIGFIIALAAWLIIELIVSGLVSGEFDESRYI